MIELIAVWSILVIIGVFDAREHRIPNILVILILGIASIDLIFNAPPEQTQQLLWHSLTGFGLCFLLSFLLYLFKAMAAGDVKLIAVLGFLLGQDELLNYLQVTSWVCVVVGSMYWLLNRAARPARQAISQPANGTEIKPRFYYVPSGLAFVALPVTSMPFAPILVIGLAMYQYVY